jgi:hypothetical protein
MEGKRERGSDKERMEDEEFEEGWMRRMEMRRGRDTYRDNSHDSKRGCGACRADHWSKRGILFFHMLVKR